MGGGIKEDKLKLETVRCHSPCCTMWCASSWLTHIHTDSQKQTAGSGTHSWGKCHQHYRTSILLKKKKPYHFNSETGKGERVCTIQMDHIRITRAEFKRGRNSIQLCYLHCFSNPMLFWNKKDHPYYKVCTRSLKSTRTHLAEFCWYLSPQVKPPKTLWSRFLH